MNVVTDATVATIFVLSVIILLFSNLKKRFKLRRSMKRPIELNTTHLVNR